MQTPEEAADRIDSTVQRNLVENIQRASLGADVVKLQEAMSRRPSSTSRHSTVTVIVVGQSRRSWWHHLRHGSVITRLVTNAANLDVLVVG